MKNLERLVPGPAVLLNFDYRIHAWKKLKGNNKKVVWDFLVLMQGKRCAYCERKININDNNDKHIEHFFPKGENQPLTFEWSNLFGSCAAKDHCGFYKDNQTYSPGVLIKADVDHPESYFHFGVDGTLNLRDGLNPAQTLRANETLRIFNLNGESGGVKTERVQCISETWSLIMKYIDTAKEFVEANEYDDVLRRELQSSYYEEVEARAFSTMLINIFDTMLP